MNITPQSIYDWYRNTIRNPKYRGWIILGTLFYLVSPIDIAPDFIPIVGQIDDIFILSLLVTEISQLVLDYAKERKNKSVPTSTEEPKQDTVDVKSIPLE